MRAKFSKSLFGIVCLSLAVGLLLYWAMFINVLPRTLRPEASAVLPVLSALVGASVCGLLYLGFRGVLPPLRRGVGGGGGLVLRRDRFGRVVAIKASEGQPVVIRRSMVLEGRVKVSGASEGRLRLLKGVVLLLVVLEAYLLTVHAMGTWVPFYVIPSNSMAPTLSVGDVVVVRRVEPKSVSVGDIIVFNVPEAYAWLSPSPVVHRVVAVEWSGDKPYFRTKGDNSGNVDPWLVPEENVLGVCVARVPYLGYVVLALKTPPVLAAAASALLAWVLYPYLRRMLGRR
ncbi:MAG: signal peptidase I [Candidatus Jordarchaeales archaeon]